ncbi:MAG: low specificity L-threonine aldolase [Rhodobacteraceae bacterium]|nr:MAG: low specificity L-threonine aldolase [Paracoccaceae bacterium]
MFFASDNTSGLPGPIMDALIRANDGFASGYGTDAYMDGLRTKIRRLFDAPEAEMMLVTTGTAANALALATLCPPWGAVYCHPLAHIEVDECGAPEFFTNGAKLVHVPGTDGKIDPDALDAQLAQSGRGVVHHVQPACLSLTNLTECGTRYSVAELTTLCTIAHRHGLPVHLDGARFANALAAEGCTPAEMSWRAGVDVLVLGGTKNGLMGVEAVVFFNPDRFWEAQLRRKRAGHLWSKHRYLSAQMLAWFEGGLWLELATQANAHAARLAEGLAGKLMFPRGGNMLFATLPRTTHDALQAQGAQYYLWPDHQQMNFADTVCMRLVTSWASSDAEIDSFLNIVTAKR